MAWPEHPFFLVTQAAVHCSISFKACVFIRLIEIKQHLLAFCGNEGEEEEDEDDEENGEYDSEESGTEESGNDDDDEDAESQSSQMNAE